MCGLINPYGADEISLGLQCITKTAVCPGMLSVEPDGFAEGGYSTLDEALSLQGTAAAKALRSMVGSAGVGGKSAVISVSEG